jgi:gliding motility-associated-like protein
MRARNPLCLSLILIATYVISSSQASAQTTITASTLTSNTMWTKAASPYIVTNNLMVAGGVSLTLEPGTVVKFEPNVQLIVAGALIANGNSNDSIYFLRNSSTQNWAGITFSVGSVASSISNQYAYQSGSVFNYCAVRNVTSTNAAIYTVNTALYISNTTINQNNANGIRFAYSGMFTNLDKVVIANSKISNNSFNGIQFDAYQLGGHLRIINNTISNNTLNGVKTDEVGSHVTHTYYIAGNTVIGNGQTGIETSCNGLQTIENNLVYNNGIGIKTRGTGITSSNTFNTFTIQQNRVIGNINYGIQPQYATHNIQKNLVASNGGAIRLNENGTYVINNNNFTGNSHFIDLPSFGSNDAPVDLKYNLVTRHVSYTNSLINISSVNSAQPDYKINNNKIDYNHNPYLVYNNRSVTNNSINASNTYWGTTVEATIKEKIYDYEDNNQKSLVNITPVRSTIDNSVALFPVRNVRKSVVGSAVELTWSASPESDVTGYKIYYGGFTGYSYANTISLTGTSTVTYTMPAGVSIDEDIAITAIDATSTGTDDQINGYESWYAPAHSNPLPPSNLVADSAARRIRLSWTASTSTGVNAYYVYRSTNNNTFTYAGKSSTTSFVDSNLTAHTRYYYRITAFDSLNLSYDNFGLESSATSVVTATPSNITYVSNNGNNSNIGSFGSPKLTIIHSIDAAASGDSIILFRGLYKEKVDLKGKVALLSSRFVQTGDTSDISQTIISGIENGNEMLIKNTATSFTPVMHVYGLTMEDARIYVIDVSIGNYSFTYKLTRSIIRNSGQPGTWGVISLGNGGVFDSCTVYGLKGRYILSSGLYNQPAPQILNSRFFNNSIDNTSSSSSYAGENSVIYVGGTNKARVSGNLIYRNRTSGIHFGGNGADSMIFVNNTIVLNEGYGIRFQTWGGVYMGVLMNNIIAYNKLENLSCNTVTNGPSVYVKNNFIGANASIAATGLASANNTILDTTGNIGGNPYFVDTLNNDFRLLAWSPCIASGIVSNYLTAKDILGQPRINVQRSVPDMGAYESAFKFRSPIFTKTEPEHKRNVLFWTQSPTTNITGYRIYRSTSSIPDTSTMAFIAQVLTPTTLTFIDSVGITNGTTYYYRLKSVDNTNTLSGFSNQLTAIPDSVAAPTNLVLHNSPSRARLSWTSSGSVAKFQVFRGTTINTRTLLADSVLGTTYNDTTLARNTYYLYWVKAMNATGALSPYSDEIQLTPTNTWHVDSLTGNDVTGIGSTSLPYRRITKAVANTITSDSVLVRPGTYQETVLIQRPIFLVSTKGPDSTRIYQEPLATTLVTLSDPVFNNFVSNLRTHVVGFRFVRNPAQSDQSTAIRVERSFYATLRNLFIDSFTFAVSTYYGYYDMYNTVVNNNTHIFGNDVADASRVNNVINSNFINTRSNLTLSNTIVVNKFYNSVILNSPTVPFASTPFSGPKVHFYNSIIDSRLQSYVPETGSTYSYLTNADSAGFTSLSSKNFTLLNNSQLIARGGLDFSNTSDFFGNVRPQPAGTLPDVGAFESIYGVTAPTFNLVEPGNRHVVLYWNQVPTTAIAGYKVYRSTSPISDTASLAPLATVPASLGTVFTDSFGVVNNTLYYYRLKAVRNDSLLSGFSIQRTARPDSVGLPTNLALDNSPRFARLTWTGITQPNSRYQVYRSLDSLSKTLIADTVNALTYTDTSFNRNTVYFYFLRAINSTGALSTYTEGIRLTPINKWQVDSTLGNNSTGIGSLLAPYRTISLAVNNAVTNDTIQVKKGTYVENVFVNGKVLAIFGIQGAEQTIIRPLQAAPIMRFTNAGSSYVKGFTFANGSPQVPGSAIAETNSNPIITNCVFRNNGAAGGVIITYGGSFELYNSIAYNNNPNTFFELSNQVTAVPKIYHFTYANNSGNFYNAGNSGSVVPIPEFRNCIIWSSTNPLISGVISLENSIIKGGFAGTTSNLDISPSFVDSARNDFRLANSSRAIGVGVGSLGIMRDFNDSLRPGPVGSSPDLGAYESPYGHPSPIVVADSSRNGIISFGWTQTPLSTVNKFYVYKDTLPSIQRLYDSTALVYSYSDTGNTIFNKILYYNFTSIGTGLLESGTSNQIRTIAYTPPALVFPADSAIGVDTIIRLRWNRIPNATRYFLQLSTDSTFTTATQQYTVTDTFYTRSGLPGNTMYYWRVQTRDSVRFSTWSPRKKFETFVLPPRLISVNPGNKRDTLTWSNPNSTNIASFRIYRSRDTVNRTLLVSVPGTQLSYIDTNALMLDSTYYYWITAVNQVGTVSAYSNRLSGKPFNKRPQTVSLQNKTFDNVGEFNFVRCVYSMIGSVDPDGQIVSHQWYVNDSLVAVGDTTLIYYYARGTNKLRLITIDNDGAMDTANATIVLRTFTRQFTGGILGGITAVSPSIIYTADSTYSPITGASIFKLDRLGNTTYPLIVSSKIFTTPSVASDSSVFITSGSSLNGFNKAGVSLWPTIPLGGLSYVTPTIDSMHRRIYVGVSNANFLAVNYLTGTVAWSIFCDAPIKNSAVITGDRKLVFVSQSGTLYGFNIVSDSVQTAPRWNQNLGEIISKSGAVDLNNDLYFGTESGKLIKVRLLPNGTVQQLWSVSLGSSVESSPVIDASGYVYAGTNAGTFHRVNTENGQLMWSRQSVGAIKSTPAVTDFGNIVYATMEGNIVAVDSLNNVKWSHKEQSPVSANLLYINNIVYVGTQSGSFIGLYDNPTTNTVNTSLSYNRLLQLARADHPSLCDLSDEPVKVINIADWGLPAPDVSPVSGTTAEPIWGTFQGNYRRTGSRALDCPERPSISRVGVTSICAGDSIRLSTSSTVNTTWVYNGLPLNLSDTVLFARAAGTYMRMNFFDNGCKKYSDTFTLVVNPVPQRPTISVNGNLSFCEGGSTQLSSSSLSNNSWYRAGSTSIVSANQTLSVNTSGNYFVRVTNSNGCISNSDTLVLNVYPRPATPVVTVTRTQFCVGDSAVLSTGSTLQRQWLSSGLPIQNASATSFVVRSAGLYSLRVTDANGCTNTSDLLQIDVNPLPTITVVSNPASGIICEGTPMTLTASGAATYSWTGGITNGVAFTPGQSANYVVTGTDANGCINTAMRFISVNPLPVLSIASIPATGGVCEGSQVVLTASGAATYSWTGGITNGVAFIPTQSGTYVVTGTSANGCTTTASRSITIHPNPTIQISNPASTVICEGSSVTLSTTATNASSYQWYVNGSPVIGAVLSTFGASGAGSYQVMAISNQGCQTSLTQPLALSLVRTPVADFSFDTYCINTPIRFTNLSQVAGSGTVNWLWNFGDNNTSTQQQPTYTYTQSGIYNVSLRVAPQLCPDLARTQSRNISVDRPVAATAYPFVKALASTATPLSARTIGVSYLWTPSTGLNNALIANPVFSATQPQNYTIRITAASGCVTTDTLKVFVFDAVDIFVPKAFTPNADGQNDRLYPELVGLTLRYFRVYNRWGQLIYEMRGSTNAGWDGTNNGQRQPMDTYTWYAEGVDRSGQVIKRNGQTLLIR